MISKSETMKPFDPSKASERYADHPFTIARVTVRTVTPPPVPRAFYDATMGPFPRFDYQWVTLQDKDGSVGESPCFPVLSFYGPPLFEALLGLGQTTYGTIRRTLYWIIRNMGFRSQAACALGAVDMALHDMMARRAELSLHRFWGATRDAVRVYGSGAGTHLNENETVEELLGFVEAGHRVVKMKVGTHFGTEMARDVKRVAGARRALGPGIAIAIDANQCWNGEDALRFAETVAEYDIAWYEEPVHSSDLEAMGQVAARCPFPVAMGESERTYHGFNSMHKVGIQHLQPAPHILSGVEEWMAVRDLAAANGRTLSSGGYTPVSAVYIATAPDSATTEYLAPLLKTFNHTLARGPQLADGYVALPSEPGIPVTPDWERLGAAGDVEEIVFQS